MIDHPALTPDQRHAYEMHERMERGIAEHMAAHRAAMAAGDSTRAERSAYLLSLVAIHAIGAMRTAMLESADRRLALSRYVADDTGEPLAPVIDGYEYAASTGRVWTCIAVQHTKTIAVPGVGGTLLYSQEHCYPDEKTLCGRRSYGAASITPHRHNVPRRAVCPECVAAMGERWANALCRSAGEPRDGYGGW